MMPCAAASCQCQPRTQAEGHAGAAPLTVSNDLHAAGVSQAQPIGVRSAPLPPHKRHQRQAAVAQHALAAQVLQAGRERR